MEQLEIDTNLILEEMENLDEAFLYEKLEKMIQKKVACNHKYSSNMLREKLHQEFIHLGYNHDMILSILETVDTSNHLLDLEYEKIYKKYSQKYTGQELRNKMKQKLYQKGFDLRDIETLLGTLE